MSFEMLSRSMNHPYQVSLGKNQATRKANGLAA
jgi:hypothetical protein